MSYKKKGCLGCMGGVVLFLVLGLCGYVLLKKDFAEHRDDILAQVQVADTAHDYQRVAELGDKYESLDDPQLNRYLATAHAALKEANEKKEVARKATEEKEQAEKKADEKKEQAAKEEAETKPKKSHKTGSDAGFMVGFSDEQSGRPQRSFREIEAAAKGITRDFANAGEKQDFIEGFEEGYYVGWDSAK